MDAVLFNISRRRYALEVRQVDEVVPLGPITPVPCVSPAVLGAMNVRGQVMAVLDAGALLGEPGSPAPPAGVGLLIHAEGNQVVLCVDRVEGVVPISELDGPTGLEPRPVLLAPDRLLCELLEALRHVAEPS